MTKQLLLEEIKKQVKDRDFAEISFHVLRHTHGMSNPEREANPIATKIAGKLGLQFNILWNYHLISFRKRGCKVGLGA